MECKTSGDFYSKFANYVNQVWGEGGMHIVDLINLRSLIENNNIIFVITWLCKYIEQYDFNTR